LHEYLCININIIYDLFLLYYIEHIQDISHTHGVYIGYPSTLIDPSIFIDIVSYVIEDTLVESTPSVLLEHVLCVILINYI